MDKDLTIGGFAMKQLDNIEKRLEEIRDELAAHRKEMTKLNNEYNAIRLKDITEKITRYKKFYRFMDNEGYDVMYTGIVTDLWYSKEEGKYMFEFFGFGGEHECYDMDWFSYDAMFQWYIAPEKMENFLSYFVEISEQTFWNDYKNHLKRMEESMKDYMKYYKNV